MTFFKKFYPHILLTFSLLIWLFSGITAHYPIVWLAEAVWIVMGFFIVVFFYPEIKFSNLSYSLIFVFFVLTQIGSWYSYSHVPYNDLIFNHSGFNLNHWLGTERNHFDRLVHFCSGFLLFLPILELVKQSTPLKGHAFLERFFSFLIITAFCALWELYEWMGVWIVSIESYWLFLGLQNDIFDAQKDMALGVFGAGLAWGFLHASVVVKKKRIVGLLVIFIITSTSAFAQMVDATAVVRKATEKVEGESLVSEVTMQVIRPGWQNEVRLKSWSKGNRLALILITAPAKDKGQTYLKRENELWNWLPGIQKTVKLSSTLMSQSWMGSDFNNEDLINKASFLNDYQHRFLMMEEIRGTECYKIELLPKDDAPVVWGKVFIWISKEAYDQLKAAFYDENDQLVRTMNAFDLKKFGHKTTPSRIEMQPAQKPRQKTVMIIENYEFNRPLANDFFSQQNMKRVR